MSPEERFKRLEAETKPRPDNVKEAVAKLDRFGHLEIGDLKSERAAPSTTTGSSDRVLCSHCGQSNEAVRDVCWACFKPLHEETPSKPEAGQEIQLILDGQTYRSSDPNVPPDIQVLMDRIRNEGYSDALLTQWRQWRATRNESDPLAHTFEQAPAALHEATAFQGQRVSIIRIDNTVYHSDDANLRPEIRELFNYIDQNGVTPELMDHLRHYGDKVKFRPHTTSQPSDGDIDFWNSAASRRMFRVAPPVWTEPALRIFSIPLTQEAIRLSLSVGIPALVILWIWWHYFSTVKQAFG